MLGKYIKINNKTMPNPTSFSYKYNADENIFMSEAGTQMSNIRRLDRLSFSATYPCSSRLRDELIGYCQEPSVDIELENNETVITGRLRLNGDITLVEDSEYTTGTEGLWNVPVIFEGE